MEIFETHRPDDGATVFDRLAAIIRESRVACVLHEHMPTRTMEDAARNLSFELDRIVKTIAFRTRSDMLVLAALRGTRRVAYPGLAALLGCSRREVNPLSAQEVFERLGVEPGSVSPVADGGSAVIFLDADVLTIAPTLYCGLGRPDRTLEIAPADLLRLAGGRIGQFSR